MPSWWGKSASKEAKKKGNKESFIDSIHRKFKSASEDKSNSRSGGSRRLSDIVSERGSLSRVPSRSPSPSTQVSRCQSFVERPVQRSHAQPLPLPRTHRSNIGRSDSNINGSLKSEHDKSQKPSVFPLPEPGCVINRQYPTDAEGDIASADVSSTSSSDSDDPTESRLLSPLTSDYENGNKTAMNSPPSSVMHKDPSFTLNQKNLKETFKAPNLQFNNQILSTSPKKKHSIMQMQNLQIPPHGAFCSAPDSSMSSPSRSPMRAFGAEQFVTSGFWAGKTYPDIASAHCSSPGSGHNSGHNSVGGDMSGQLFWQSRCSPECSPIPSPRMISPGPSSRIHSGAVTPLHPRASGGGTESSITRLDDGKQQSHRLPLPPLTITHTSPFSPTYSASTTPSVPRSPGRAENPTSPGSRWKKGKLLGRGTFGHVYLGFNSEGGKMCAMKEVTLFSDDAKSRESAQQLGQEITLLSRLQHPNIVQYYGFETVDDKLYIYLEYVSGGSIYKLLQEYGHFGEAVIRSYTQQILSGLAYLHNKNTVHRDIKGANILVDPSGRVKLADFGMAKHITGQSCPLSFKGSPYWMAPEVIKNSNGCNLAVDIWSLGCTVLEMATTKPPWSQYEGVAAMFKIGNSKELPAIPDNLSAEGKDFVLQCLQRNPANRPSASQLLDHAFVKNAAPLERPIPSPGPSEGPPPPPSTNAPRPTGIGNSRNHCSLESEWVGNYQSRGSKIGKRCSEAMNIPRNISCPVSPIGSPLLHSRSPHHMSGRMSPSPISSPHTMSGASTPLTAGGGGGGGGGALPFHLHPKQPTSYLPEAMGTVPRCQNGFYTTSSSPYHDQKPELFRVHPQASQAFRDIISSENCTLGGGQIARPAGSGEFYDAQSVLADRLSAAFERPRKV